MATRDFGSGPASLGPTVHRWVALALSCGLACGAPAPDGTVVTFPGSAVGAEAELLREQLERFARERPEIRVVQRRTPDAADQRRQLYVQWLNAHAPDPDVLQLDVVWTAEFAAAGWLLPLARFAPDTADYFAATLEANRWRGALYALPWFVDVGLLYWRSDLLDRAPGRYDALVGAARAAVRKGDLRYGLVWQGARYEGLVTVFVEHLAAFGGAILAPDGRVVVDAPPAVAALEAMRDAVEEGLVPREALTWHEEQTRFAFQNGEALFMRNWPYAAALLADPARSAVAGRFGVAPFPGGSALGGAQLAINARSDAPEAAFALVEFLTRPEQARERAVRLGQYPPRPSLYDEPALADALPVPARAARASVESAVPRPVTPVYAELSLGLQVWLHRALTGQAEPREALRAAAAEMRALLARSGLAGAEGA